MIKIAVNGYGVIGRRIADIVSIQPDMQLLGITKVHPDYRAYSAIRKGYKVYAVDEKSKLALKNGGVKVQGLVRDLIAQADIVVDSSPEDTGAQNISLYKEL
ncbi:MAG: glyceraldehyde-3-phosphate dehydrogenase, partial [Nitrososphaerota archaeon]|nr:glyceraldehyde-3-phosphate dehydrogenase [Nitrososphaerota archaeon]